MVEHSTIVHNDPSLILRAGGIADIDSSPDSSLRCSAVSARSYVHPVLVDRVIVRLEPDAISSAADAEMDALGFGEPAVESSLGKRQYRTVGFPGWAIINDPKHARFALEVTREFKKAAKRVASKPGHAKDAFDEIAARLSRSVPHFLPSYWEEVGRAFLQEASIAFASQSFEKARAAEKQYNLSVDEQARADAFLEFALAGAVAAKTLSAYAKELDKSSGAACAFDRFRELALRRTLGGVPPWAGMGKELAALCKGAKRDLDAEDLAFVLELVGCAAVARAPADFWSHYKKALVQLARTKAGVCKWLLELFPSPVSSYRGVPDGVRGGWLEILEESGSLAMIANKNALASDLPSAGLGPWLTRFIRYLGDGPKTRQVVLSLVDRIREQEHAVGVEVASGWRSVVSLDLAELLLSQGVSLAPLASTHIHFALSSATCDPILVSKDPVYGPLLVRDVGDAFGKAEFEVAARGKKGFIEARRSWLEGHISGLESDYLNDSDEAAKELNSRTTADTFHEFPDALDRIRNVSVSRILRENLRAGIIDEYSWPAYEDACKELGGLATCTGIFPYLVLHLGARVIVIGPSGRVLEHDLVLDSKKQEFQRAAYLDGSLLVSYYDRGVPEHGAYWSHEPQTRFACMLPSYGWSNANQISISPSGVSTGAKPIHRGDTQLPDLGKVNSDGTSYWVYRYANGKYQTVEIDPNTGVEGRTSRPTFFEQFIAPDSELRESSCYVFPVPAGCSNSFLGSADGLIALRVRATSGSLRIESIDGRSWEGAADLVSHPVGIPPLPASSAFMLLCRGAGRYDQSNALLLDKHGKRVSSPNMDQWSGSAWGDLGVVAPEYFHFARVRDAEGSKVLRDISLEQAEFLLKVAGEEFADKSVISKKALTRTIAAVASHLPAIADEGLRGAVAMAAAKAATILRSIESIVAKGAIPVAESKNASRNAQMIDRFLCALLDATIKPEWPDFEWREYLLFPRASAFLAISALTSDSDRKECIGILQMLTESSIGSELEKMRYVDATPKAGFNAIPNSYGRSACRISGSNGSSIVGYHDYHGVHYIEWSEIGFQDLPDTILQKEYRFGHLPSHAWIEAFANRAESHCYDAIDPAAVEALCKALGMTKGEASLLWGGVPTGKKWVKDYLGAEIRAKLGLKVSEADAARGIFKNIDRFEILAVLEKVASDDPCGLFEPMEIDSTGQSAVSRLVTAWAETFGIRPSVPEDLAVLCDKELGTRVGATELLRAIVSAGNSTLLEMPELPKTGFPSITGSDSDGLNPDTVSSFALILPFLALHLPVGDPVLNQVRGFHDKLIEAMDFPSLLFPMGTLYSDSTKPDFVDKFLELIGGEAIPEEQLAGKKGVDNGLLRAVANYYVEVAFRPSKLNASTWSEVSRISRALSSSQATTSSVLFLRSEECLALIAQMLDPSLPAGSFAANPRVSVPGLVSEVATDKSLSDDAASLYLQMIALPEPTSKAVCRWNNWSTVVYKKAATELQRAKLVVDGKRERAGRDIFLPGEWLKGEGKNLPMEAWKRKLLETDYGALSRHLPVIPTANLFEKAWFRVKQGDLPKFEEVK